jgi:hypothetical protein
MKLLWNLLFLAVLFSNGPALSWTHGLYVAPPGSQGLAVLNYGTGDLTAQSFINIFWSAGSFGFNSGATPSALNSDGFPVRNFSGTIGSQVGPSSQTLSVAAGWQLKWDAGVSCFKIIFLKAGTTSNLVGSPTITNGGGAGNLAVQGGCGPAGSVDIDWNDTSGITYSFDGTYTSWGSNTSGKFALLRKSDLTAYTNGTYWTPEAVSLVSALKPESLRFMGMNVLLIDGLIGTDASNYTTRKTPNSFSWLCCDYPPGIWAGSASTPTVFGAITNTNNQLSAGPAVNTSLAGWVDGEQIMGALSATMTGLQISAVANNGGKCQFTADPAQVGNLSPGMRIWNYVIVAARECDSQSTTVLTVDSATQFTVDVNKTGAGGASLGWVGYQELSIAGKSGGSKQIVDIKLAPFGLNGSLAAGTVTLTYKSDLDRVIATPNPVSNSPPVEAQIQLANLTGANFWYNIPTFYTDAAITSTANLTKANLNSNLKFVLELGNELWNNGQDGYFYILGTSQKMGLSQTDPYAYSTLRSRIINGNLIPASNWSSSMSRVVRSFCFQGPAGGTSFLVNPLQGSYLASYGYNVFPQRPVDFVDAICQAPYLGGGWLFSGQSNDSFLVPTTFDKPVYDQIVTLTNAPNVAAANALIDSIIRGDAGTRTQTITWDAGNSRWQTPLTHNIGAGQVIRITVTGGTACGNLSLLNAYKVLTVPTSDTMIIGKLDKGVQSSAVACGFAATGTMSVFTIGDSQGGANNSPYTIFGQMSTTTTKWNDVVTAGSSAGFSPAPATGQVISRQYEGAVEPSTPTSGQCTTVGLSGTDCTTIATAFANWQASSLARATMKYYYDQYIGAAAGVLTTSAVPNNFGPAQLVLQGGGLYGLNGNSSYTAPSLRQTYYGFCDFSTGTVCHHMEPSNDNDPLWEDKAA